MTNEYLDRMNIKIARKLGWTRFRLERTPEPLNTRRMTGLAPGNIRNQFVPHFTSNLAYALQLVDWASQHGFVFELAKYSKEQPYQASFYRGGREEIDWGTLPSMAICLAFLKIK